MAQWANHLTTLFPEVRPRGHLELRSIDALPPEDLVAPLALVAGIAYDPRAAAEARALVPTVDEHLLNRAARCGVYDGDIASIARDLVRIGLRGASRLGERIVAAADVERAATIIGSRLENVVLSQ